MAIATRREDSVVSALGELRGIEDARRRAELDAAQRELEARLAAQRAAADAARCEAEAAERRRADDVHQAAVKAEAIARAERLVAIESEARAKATAEIALAAERQAQELAIRRELAARARPRGLIAAVAVLGLGAAALGALAFTSGRERDLARTEVRLAAGAADSLRADVRRLERQVGDLRTELDAARRAATAVVTPTPAAPAPAPTKKGGGGGGGGGGGKKGGGSTSGTGTGTNNQVNLSSKCIDDPLGQACPTTK